MSDPSLTRLDSATSWFLIFAHPGHELRAHHFLERVQPTVAVLTDGSGATGASRLDQTRESLANTGARPAPIFGVLSDRDAYAALMAADAKPFVALRDQLADLLREQRAGAVVVDAAEGYNPVHDICHWLGRAAVAKARRAVEHIDVFELDLMSHPNGAGSGLRLALDDRAFERKLEAVARYHALAREAEAAFDHHGRDAFRVEFLRRVVDAPVPSRSWVPYYEEIGETRVSTGRYTSVLRYAHHVRPVIETLLELPPPSFHAEDLGTLHQ